jgi:hypothetical protein
VGFSRHIGSAPQRFGIRQRYSEATGSPGYEMIRSIDFHLLEPNVMVPKHSLLTFNPVFPSDTISIIYSSP